MSMQRITRRVGRGADSVVDTERRDWPRAGLVSRADSPVAVPSAQVASSPSRGTPARRGGRSRNRHRWQPGSRACYRLRADAHDGRRAPRCGMADRGRSRRLRRSIRCATRIPSPGGGQSAGASGDVNRIRHRFAAGCSLAIAAHGELFHAPEDRARVGAPMPRGSACRCAVPACVRRLTFEPVPLPHDRARPARMSSSTTRILAYLARPLDQAPARLLNTKPPGWPRREAPRDATSPSSGPRQPTGRSF